MNSEKIEILFDQICTQLEGIKSHITNKPDNQPSAIDSNDQEINDRLDGLEKGQVEVNKNLINMGDRFREQDKAVRAWKPIHKTEVEVNHVFFPGIVEWLMAFKLWRINVIFGFFLAISLILNWTWYSEKEEYYDGFLQLYMLDNFDLTLGQIQSYIEKNETGFYDYADSIYHHELETMRLQNEIHQLQQQEQELLGK